jgi:23S rRNA (uracil1939-C5)-methyltransferase
MSPATAKNPILKIDTLSYGPYGIGRLDGKAIMVSHTAPGDTIEARIVEAKERYALAEAVRLIEPSPLRRTPPCPYVGVCGGCSWQHLRYDAQLKAKEQSVVDALRRIGKLDGYELRPIIASTRELGYRRRIRLQVGPDRQLGFFGASSHRLVGIDSCLIAGEPLNGLLDSLRRWARGLETAIEHIELVSGDGPGELIAVAQANGDFAPRDEHRCEDLIADAVFYGLIVAGYNWRKTWGITALTVNLIDEISLTVDADVFTQVNPEGNLHILRALLGAGEFQASDRALELYCGAGNFTLPIAKRVREICAVEGHRAAIACGKLNAQKHGLENIRWTSAGVPQAVARLKSRRERFDKIVLDPPRAGAKDLDADLAALGAKKILYISCNPTTLARDLAALAKRGYTLQTVQPIDLFPQTFHVEALAVMER